LSGFLNVHTDARFGFGYLAQKSAIGSAAANGAHLSEVTSPATRNSEKASTGCSQFIVRTCFSEAWSFGDRVILQLYAVVKADLAAEDTFV
jgi:hypothetical protein